MTTPNPLPGTPISSLPTAISISLSDYLPGVQGGTTKRFPMSLIQSFVGSATIVSSIQVSAAGDYTLLATDQIVYLTGAHTRNVNLMPAADVVGHFFWIKVDANGATNTQKILPFFGDTIEGLIEIDLSGAYQWVLIYAQSSGLWLLFT